MLSKKNVGILKVKSRWGQKKKEGHLRGDYSQMQSVRCVLERERKDGCVGVDDRLSVRSHVPA